MSRSCEVCRRQSHVKWHEVARSEVNPVALIESIEGLPDVAPAALKTAIAGYVIAITGMDMQAMRLALKVEREA